MKTVQLWQLIDPVGVWVQVGSVDLSEELYSTTLCIDVPERNTNKDAPLGLVKYHRMHQSAKSDIFVNYTNTFICKK
jgi:hypothetical protein